MKSPSLKIWELIQKLHAGQNLLDKFFGRRSALLDVFDEIASLGEISAIPNLTVFLLNEQNDVRLAAARVIGQLVANVPSLEFVQLDEICRNNWAYESSASSAWRRLKPDDLKSFWRLPNSVSVMGMASCHGNGFIRDAAVNELANIFDGSELPFLLIRLNDWVEAVRESATVAILHRIRPDYAPHFFRHLQLVLRLQTCGRSQHKQIITAVTGLLQEPAAMPILREGILSKDRWLRRESFRIAIAGRSEQSSVLLKEMLADADPIMRLWAVRNVLNRLDDVELKPLLAILVCDGFMPVRYEALSFFTRRFPTDVACELHSALLDAHSSIRAFARYAIRNQQPDFDVVSFYRQALHKRPQKQQRTGILGIGETGTAADAAAIAPFTEVASISVGKAAIRALAALDGNSYLEKFIAALASEHVGISNEATRAIGRKAALILDRLQLLFRAGSPRYVRKNLFRLLCYQSFWVRGIFLFEALRDRDEHIIEMSRRALSDWLVRSRNMAAAPSHDEIKQLHNALKASAGMLPPAEVQELEFAFKSYQ